MTVMVEFYYKAKGRMLLIAQLSPSPLSFIKVFDTVRVRYWLI